jgi:Cof subfamily protein (haloacid dehalogenase superfamily)
MTFKAICSDIDGTLLNSERDLSPRLKAVVAAIPIKIPLILASSRMPAAMRHLLHDLHRPTEALVAYNGGLVLDENGQVLESVTIPLHWVEEVARRTKDTQIHLSLFHGEEWFEPQEDLWSSREIQNTKVTPTWMGTEDVISMWATKNWGAHKIMCMGEPNAIRELFDYLFLQASESLHLYRPKETYLEIAPKQISKATGLARILQASHSFGLDQVVAFGDSYNDIELLEQVGWGVAVANAIPEVKAVAQELTLHHKEDGVASTLARIFLDKK